MEEALKNSSEELIQALIEAIKETIRFWRPRGGGKRKATLASFFTFAYIVEYLLSKIEEPERGDVIIVGTLAPNIHKPGPRLAELILKLRGYRAIYVGVCVRPKKFVELAQQYNAKAIIACIYVSKRVPDMTGTVKQNDRYCVDKNVEKLISLLKESGLPCKLYLAGYATKGFKNVEGVIVLDTFESLLDLKL